MKKILALLIAMGMISTMLIGCGGSTDEKPQQSTAQGSNTELKQEAVKFNYVIPGDAPKDYDLVASEINKRLLADNVGIELERTYIPWDAWEQKINLMLATGDEFDMFHVMNDSIPLTSYVGKNALLDVTELINKYGSNIKKNVPDSIFSGASVDGKMYAVPTYWYELSTYGAMNIRKDILKQYNLQIPKTPDELLKDAEIIIKGWKGKNKPYFGNMMTGMDPNEIPVHRTYDSWPFSVKDYLFYIDANGEIKSWVETPEFKKDAEFMRKAYKIGLINPDILTLKSEQLSAYADSGDWFVSSGTGASRVAGIKMNNPNATIDDVVPFFFNPEKPYMRPMTVKNCNAIPLNSKHPEAGIKFLNWLWANQDNFDLYFYGIEGKHYEKVGEHGVKLILDPNNNNQPNYTDSVWMAGNINLIRVDDVNDFPANNKLLYTAMPGAVNNPAANFQFDASTVMAEYANVKTQEATLMAAIFMGVVDYDSSYASALDKMKKAGLNKVVEEYKRQYKEWKAKGGK